MKDCLKGPASLRFRLNRDPSDAPEKSPGVPAQDGDMVIPVSHLYANRRTAAYQSPF